MVTLSVVAVSYFCSAPCGCGQRLEATCLNSTAPCTIWYTSRGEEKGGGRSDWHSGRDKRGFNLCGQNSWPQLCKSNTFLTSPEVQMVGSVVTLVDTSCILHSIQNIHLPVTEQSESNVHYLCRVHLNQFSMSVQLV